MSLDPIQLASRDGADSANPTLPTASTVGITEESRRCEFAPSDLQGRLEQRDIPSSHVSRLRLAKYAAALPSGPLNWGSTLLQ